MIVFFVFSSILMDCWIFLLLFAFGGLCILVRGGLTFSFFFSFDIFSFFIILLTSLVFFSCLLVSFGERHLFRTWGTFSKVFFFLFFVLSLLFCRTDLFTLFIFFEITIFPTFYIVRGWGYTVNRLQSSWFIFFFIIFGSLPFLFFILYFYAGGFSVASFTGIDTISFFDSLWLFLCVLVFIIKLPLFILHLWLPKAHVDAPLLGSIVLAGVLLKMGGYGLLKIFSFSYSFRVLIGNRLFFLGIVGSILVGFLSLRQVDIKSLVAYSSVVHMGPVFLCFFLLSYYSIISSFLVMFCHGFCSCGLFYLLTYCYNWIGRRSLFLIRGGLFLRPVFGYVWIIFSLINMSCPPSFNFFSEIILIFRSFYYSLTLLYLFFFIMTLVGFYCIYLLMSVYFGDSSFRGIFSFYFLRVLDLLNCFLLLFPLLFYLFFIGLLVCW